MVGAAGEGPELFRLVKELIAFPANPEGFDAGAGAPPVPLADELTEGFCRTCLFSSAPAVPAAFPANLKPAWNLGSLRSAIDGTVMPYLFVGADPTRGPDPGLVTLLVLLICVALAALSEWWSAGGAGGCEARGAGGAVHSTDDRHPASDGSQVKLSIISIQFDHGTSSARQYRLGVSSRIARPTKGEGATHALSSGRVRHGVPARMTQERQQVELVH